MWHKREHVLKSDKLQSNLCRAVCIDMRKCTESNPALLLHLLRQLCSTASARHTTSAKRHSGVLSLNEFQQRREFWLTKAHCFEWISFQQFSWLTRDFKFWPPRWSPHGLPHSWCCAQISRSGPQGTVWWLKKYSALTWKKTISIIRFLNCTWARYGSGRKGKSWRKL